MAAFQYPIHDLAMDMPAQSEQVTREGKTGYRWMMTETEKKHIADMLQMDISTLVLRGNIMNSDRVACAGCGKHSGLDDIVHNALYAGIHSASFMADVLVNGPKAGSPAHEVTCSRCATKHQATFYWMYPIDWI